MDAEKYLRVTVDIPITPGVKKAFENHYGEKYRTKDALYTSIRLWALSTIETSLEDLLYDLTRER